MGFQYEPELSDSEEPVFPQYDSGSDNNVNDEADNERKSAPVEEWCKCTKCRSMETSQECVCCHGVDQIKYFKLEKLKCISHHEDLYSACLCKSTLWASLVRDHDRDSRGLPNRDDVSNRTYRYTAYRQFTYFIHSKLGKGVRKIIPSCVTSKIRDTFPEKDGKYVGFKGDEVINEIDVDWVEWAKDFY